MITLFLFTLLPGCSTFEQVMEGQKPTVQVVGVKLTGLDFEGIDLAFDLKVDNPNPFPIDLAGLDYDLKLLDSSFLKGEQPMGLSLAADAGSRIKVPLRLGFQQLMSTYRQLKHVDRAAYRLDLGLGFDIPVLGKVRIPIDYEGDFPLPRIPEVKVRSLHVQQLNMNGAKLLLQLEVDNPNGFSLLLERLNYNLKLNGFALGKGLLNQPLDIKRGGSGVMNLPLSLDFMQAGMGLYSALLSKSGIEYELKLQQGDTTSFNPSVPRQGGSHENLYANDRKRSADDSHFPRVH
ncbi:MAG: LEA type 2 family protein [Candidatus Thiodiazotropha sp. (ex Dulcina madagascariensis)]|nr:LEA type 2 family protein [Candidatus Thiodiazotropha sp. (ex Dulcina madagascariensis)]MCU7925121.1 LEA type 2 family protein [Candidatus Thiodiazotropha sp. (ex Dulcina madagascariensis)]